jgi:hypothetical protein
MTMYYPTPIVTGPGAAYVSVMYGMTVVWTICSVGAVLLLDRSVFKSLEEAEVIKEHAEA